MSPPERTDPDAAARRPRGWVSLYALAFLLLLGAGASMAVAAASLLASTRLLWVSSALSALAIVVAVLSVVLPRRSRRGEG